MPTKISVSNCSTRLHPISAPIRVGKHVMVSQEEYIQNLQKQKRGRSSYKSYSHDTCKMIAALLARGRDNLRQCDHDEAVMACPGLPSLATIKANPWEYSDAAPSYLVWKEKGSGKVKPYIATDLLFHVARDFIQKHDAMNNKFRKFNNANDVRLSMQRDYYFNKSHFNLLFKPAPAGAGNPKKAAFSNSSSRSVPVRDEAVPRNLSVFVSRSNEGQTRGLDHSQRAAFSPLPRHRSRQALEQLGPPQGLVSASGFTVAPHYYYTTPPRRVNQRPMPTNAVRASSSETLARLEDKTIELLLTQQQIIANHEALSKIRAIKDIIDLETTDFEGAIGERWWMD